MVVLRHSLHCPELEGVLCNGFAFLCLPCLPYSIHFSMYCMLFLGFRKLLSSSSISKPYPSMEEDEEPTHKEVVETELAMRSGFGVSLTVELPNSKVHVGTAVHTS